MLTLHTLIMPFTKEQVTQTASQQKELLERLANADYARPALEQTTRLIDDLESQLVETGTRIRSLEAVTSKEHEDHQKYHEASWRRLAYHLSGHKDKFESRAKKEEREYFDAVQEEQQAKDRLETLKKKMYELGEAKRGHEALLKEHKQAQYELDNLYESIFGGKTPNLPEEDRKEEAVLAAKRTYKQAQRNVEPESQAVNLLTQAMDSIHESISHMDDALNKPHSDLLSDTSNMGRVMEKHSLSKAQSAVSQTEMLVKQAQRLSPKIEDIGPMRVSQSAMMTVFDDPTVALRKKIEQSDTELRYAAAGLSGQLNATKRRVKALNEEASKAQQKLETERAALQQLRTQAFQRMATG